MKLDLDVLGDALEMAQLGRYSLEPQAGDVYLEKTLATAHQKILLGKPLGQGEYELVAEALERYASRGPQAWGRHQHTLEEIDAAREAFAQWPRLSEIDVPGTAPTTQPVAGEPGLEP